MKTLAEELKETALDNAIKLKNEQDQIDLAKQKAEQDRIDSILQKIYNYFESKWLEKAKEAALKGKTCFNVYLSEDGLKDKNSCYLLTGIDIEQLYAIIIDNGVNYFDPLVKHIEAQGFKNVEMRCNSSTHTTIQLDHYTIYDIYLRADF